MMEILASVTGGHLSPDRLHKGVYVSHLNFNHQIQRWIKDEYPSTIADPYGVCDNYHQILGKWPEIETDPDHRYLISMAEISRHKQPSEGGWRWHKWGPYIGNHEPKHEYLYDEKDIDLVYVYYVFEMVEYVEKRV